MLKTLLMIGFLCFLWGCSSSDTKPGLDFTETLTGQSEQASNTNKPEEEGQKPVAEPPAKEATTISKESDDTEKKAAETDPKTQDREPGSLWSAGSHWNGIFSLRTFRKPGDTLLIHPTESFRNKLGRLAAKIRNDERGTTQFEERNFVLTLREVQPGGVFIVKGQYAFLFAGEPVIAEIEARVRETEIQEDDSLSSDNLISATLKLSNSPGQTKAEDTTSQPPEASPKTAEKTASKKDEKSKVVEKVKDPNTEAAKKKRKAIREFEKKKTSTTVAKSDVKSPTDEESSEND